MNPFPPKVAPQGRYDTNTTCEKLGISRSTLARHRNAGYIFALYHKANMRPYYKGSEILRFWREVLS
jgi:predicted site-specific integrase-resolvase